MNKQNEILYKDNKDKFKNNLLNEYGYNIDKKRVIKEDYSKVFHFRNKTKIN